MQVLGAPADMAEKLAGACRSRNENIDVHPHCRESVTTFLCMTTQWRWNQGRRVGLDLKSLPVVCRSLGVRLSARLLLDVQRMEATALLWWSENVQQPEPVPQAYR